MELLLAILILLSIILLSILNLHQKTKLPPGPLGFPIIGNLFELGPKPHESLAKLARKHGPFMTIKLGSITSVVASTPEAAREILQHNDDACSSRPIPDVVNALKHPNAAILWMPPNQTWRTMRKALNMYLTIPYKLDAFSHVRQNVVDEMLEIVRNKVDVDIGKLAFSATLNQLSNTFLSQNVTSYDAGNIKGFKTAIATAMEVQGKFNVADIFPVLKPLDPQNIRRQAKEAYDWLDEVMDGYVSERLKQGESRFGDLLDSLLEYSRENEARFNLIQVKALLVDLFIAGTDTTSTIVTWTMTELLLNPDILLRVREEVNQVVGKDEKLKEAEILGLTYLHAVIKETMRLHVPAPLMAPHKTQREVKLGNYIVPTNTQIIVNVWAIARDPSYWESPSLFMPERFLRNDIDYKGQDFEFLPFGSGRRRCPGMALGHRMVCLMVASFVFHFDWKLPHAKDEMDMNDVFGLSCRRQNHLSLRLYP